MSFLSLQLNTQPKTLAKSIAAQQVYSVFNSGELNVEPLADGTQWLTSMVLLHEASGDSFEFVECLIRINQSKHIVTTALQGRNGTVKEYISDGDYLLNIEAGVISENGVYDYPIDKMSQLARLLKLNETLSVQSDFLDVFGIDSVVVSDYGLTQETHSNRQSIQISLLSDEAYIIRLNDV